MRPAVGRLLVSPIKPELPRIYSGPFVAQITGVPIGTAMPRLSRARQTLQNACADIGCLAVDLHGNEAQIALAIDQQQDRFAPRLLGLVDLGEDLIRRLDVVLRDLD